MEFITKMQETLRLTEFWRLCLRVWIFTGLLLHTVSGVTISAPSQYVAFTGDGILATYSGMNLTKAVVKLVDTSNNQVIFHIGLLAGHPDAEIKIQCGSIVYAGIFRIIIIDETTNQTVAQTGNIEVRWPHIILQIPSDLETLTGHVKLNFEIRDKVECSTGKKDITYTMQLVMYEDPDDVSLVKVVHEVTMETFNNLGLGSNPLTFNCALFDEEGDYEIRFSSNQGPPKSIAVSNTMAVTWSDEYAIGTLKEHILPCDEYFVVTYTQPRCVGDQDKIRLYEIEHATSSSAGPTNMKYRTEHRAVKGENTVRFKCDIFKSDIMEYCFKYVSRAESGVLHEHQTLCKPTQFNPAVAVDGGFSQWSDWWACSSSCEGGTQTRYRACDNPPPSFNGKNCDGETTEVQACGSKCGVSPHLSSALETTVSPIKSLTTDPECVCGCVFRQSTGTIATSTVCRGSSIWKIYVPEGQAIRLKFVHYNIKGTNGGTSLQIRNGDSFRDSLIFDGYRGEGLPDTVESTRHTMLIEFTAPLQGSSGEYSALDEGFVASFSSVVLAGAGTTDSHHSAIWSSTLLVIAILLFVAIVIAIVGFIFYHRYNIRKNNKARLQMANQALLVHGEAPPTSPSHSQSISSVKGSTNISFGDPVSSPTHKSSKKRDYVIPKSSPSSPTKLKDIKLKHKRPRSPSKGKGAKGGVVGSPPHSPHKHKVGVMPQGYSSPRTSHREKDQDASGQTPTSLYSISSHGYIPVSTLGSPANPPRATNGAQQPAGSPLATRGDARNKSFLSAVSKPGAPLAGHEELSPTTPKEFPPSYSTYLDNSTQVPFTGSPTKQEAIPLESYYTPKNKPDTYDLGRITEAGMYSPHTKRRSAKSPQDVPEKRPPVEGRDSLTRKKAEDQHPMYENMQNGSHGVTRPDIHSYPNAPVSHTRPEIKPLPLRSIQRPDGQSPDNNNRDENNVKTPNSCISSEMSPIFKKDPLFPESKSNSTMDLDMPGDNDFEYDDYVPELPGSYFSMDPHAYTLTWSQQPSKWGGAAGNHTQAPPSSSKGKNGSSMC